MHENKNFVPCADVYFCITVLLVFWKAPVRLYKMTYLCFLDSPLYNKGGCRCIVNGADLYCTLLNDTTNLDV